jgi:PAS domain-containing protein
VEPIGSGQARASAGALAATTDFSGGLVLADDIPDGLVIADHAGRVAVFNRAAARLTGISPADAVGREVSEVLPLRDGHAALRRPDHPVPAPRALHVPA